MVRTSFHWEHRLSGSTIATKLSTGILRDESKKSHSDHRLLSERPAQDPQWISRVREQHEHSSRSKAGSVLDSFLFGMEWRGWNECITRSIRISTEACGCKHTSLSTINQMLRDCPFKNDALSCFIARVNPRAWGWKRCLQSKSESSGKDSERKRNKRTSFSRRAITTTEAGC